jgi:subtilisin family serine protease
MSPLELVRLSPLMERTTGRREVTIGLIDGPVALDHPELAAERIREVPGRLPGRCAQRNSLACLHGTFVAGILCARRDAAAPAICPGCTLLVCPIFGEAEGGGPTMPSATPDELAWAVLACVEAGASVLNLSVGLVQPSARGERALEEALEHAARRGAVAVVAAGNQGAVGSTALTRCPWVIPVVACDRRGRPLGQSNLGASIGRHGLSAPGEDITSLGAGGGPLTLGGTSAATPFVTGAAALLWSAFPAATAAEVRFALTRAGGSRRNTVVPPLLDAGGAYQFLLTAQARESRP